MSILNPLKYGYSNAKISGLKSYFLTPSFYNEALNVKGVNSLIDMLLKTPYRPYIEQYLPYYKGVDVIDIATSKRIGDTLKLLRKYVKGKDLEPYEAFISQWDIISLKHFTAKKIEGKAEWSKVEPYIVEAGVKIKTYKKMFKEKDILRALRHHYVGQKILDMKIEDLPTAYRDVVFSYLKSGQRFVYFSALMDYIMLTKIRELAKINIGYTSLYFQRLLELRAVLVYERAQQKGVEIDTKELYGIEVNKRNAQRIKSMLGIEKEENIFIAEQKAMHNIAGIVRKAFPKSILTFDKVFLYLLMLEFEANNLHRIGVGKELGLERHDIEVVLV